MAPRLSRIVAVAVAALPLAGLASAYANYSTVDMARAQLALMDDRPKDCPPWYVLPPHVALLHLAIC